MKYFKNVVNLNYESSCCCILHLVEIENSGSELLIIHSMNGLGDILVWTLSDGLAASQIVFNKIVPNASELYEMSSGMYLGITIIV